MKFAFDKLIIDIRQENTIMRFLDAEFVQGFIRMANDGWEQGWHERNGGNLSYRKARRGRVR